MSRTANLAISQTARSRWLCLLSRSRRRRRRRAGEQQGRLLSKTTSVDGGRAKWRSLKRANTKNKRSRSEEIRFLKIDKSFLENRPRVCPNEILRAIKQIHQLIESAGVG